MDYHEHRTGSWLLRISSIIVVVGLVLFLVGMIKKARQQTQGMASLSTVNE